MMMKIKIMMMTILIIILVKLCPFKSIVSLRMARKCAKRRLFLVALFLWIYFCLTVFVAFIIWFEFVFLNLYFLSIYCTCKCFHIIWCPICKASIDISNNFSYCLKCYLCFGFHILNLGFCISHLVFCICASSGSGDKRVLSSVFVFVFVFLGFQILYFAFSILYLWVCQLEQWWQTSVVECICICISGFSNFVFRI